MSAVTPDGEKTYTNRSPGVVPICITIDRDAAKILRELAPGPRAHGRLISRLIYEHAVREKMRQQVREGVAPILGMLNQGEPTGV